MVSLESKRQIIVIGKIGMDQIMEVEEPPKPYKAISSKRTSYVPGGKGANQAVAASRLGGKVSFISCLGTDNYGEVLLAYLKRENLDVSGVRLTKDTPTGFAVILVDKDAKNTMILQAGSDQELSPHDLDSIRFRGGEIVVAQLNIPHNVVLEAFKRAKDHGAVTVLNASPMIKCSKEILELTDYLVVNEHEVAFLVGNDKIPESAESALEYAKNVRSNPEQVVIITLGEKGSVTLDRDRVIKIDAIKVKAIDSSGAGDAFMGGLVTSLSESKTLTEALEFANKASAISVQRLGTSASLPYRSEVEKIKANELEVEPRRKLKS